MNSKRKKLLILMFLAIVIVSAAGFLKDPDDSNIALGIRMYRLDDGATLVVNNQSRFDFTVPSGWYSLLIPVTPDELAEFNAISQKNNLPLEADWVTKHGSDDVLWLAANLDSNYYTDALNFPIELFYADIADITPSGLLQPVLDVLTSNASGRVTSSYVKDYSGQEVAILEFHSLAGETPFLAGKVLIFIRDGYIYALFGAANREEIVPQLRLTIDEISASLNFYAAK